MKLLDRILVAVAVIGAMCWWVMFNGHWPGVVDAVRNMAGTQAAESVDFFGNTSRDVGENVTDYAGGVADQLRSGEYVEPDWGQLADALGTFKPTTAERHPDFDRDEFGHGWLDPDDNGCDTRNDILRRDLTELAMHADGCKVLAGTLADPYTGRSITFTRGAATSAAVQIDHILPLKAAWDAGAWKWNDDRREQFANDPANLLASDGPANMSKGARTLSEWTPENEAFHCDYAALTVRIYDKYDLAIDDADRTEANRILDRCDG